MCRLILKFIIFRNDLRKILVTIYSSGLYIKISLKGEFMIIKILLWLFALRPILDLLWETEIILGLNVAAIVAIGSISLTLIYVLEQQMIKNVPIVLFLFIYTFLMTAINMTSLADIDNLLRLLSSMSFILVVAPNINEKHLEKFLYLFIIFTLIPIIISFMQVSGLVPFTYWDYINGERVFRASGGYRQPSVLTRFAVFGLIYSLYFLSRYKKTIGKFKKYFFYMYIILNFVALLFSYHRTGYFMSLIVVLIWFVFDNKKNLFKMINKLLIITIGLTVGFIILYSLGLFTIDIEGFQRLLSLDNIYVINNGNFELILRGRGRLIDTVVESFRLNPWYSIIFGNGVNINNTTGLSLEVADMDLLRILWNYGIIGTILWLSQMLWFINILIKSRKYLDPYIFRVGLVILVTYVIFGLTIETSVTPNFMYHVYLVLGFLYFSSRKEKLFWENKNEIKTVSKYNN